MKVIIVVFTLVKVYNIKKKTRLIVTAVSITSLYFKYILCWCKHFCTPVYIPSKSILTIFQSLELAIFSINKANKTRYNLGFPDFRNLPRAMPRKRTPDDTGGVDASGTSILHRFAPSHAIVRAFYVPLTQYSTMPSNWINLLKNLKSAKFQFEACTTMLEYVDMYDYYTKKWWNGAQYIPLNNSYYFNVYWINSYNQQTCWKFHQEIRGVEPWISRIIRPVETIDSE